MTLAPPMTQEKAQAFSAQYAQNLAKAQVENQAAAEKFYRRWRWLLRANHTTS